MEVNAQTERSKNSIHEQTWFLLKKPVESQYSSLSHKKTHTFTIIAMNSVQEQLIIFVQRTFLYQICARKKVKKNLKHNRLTSGEVLSNDRRAVGFVST